jgi:hypothetical protein
MHMSFHTAGYRPFKPSAIVSTTAEGARVQPAPVMRRFTRQTGCEDLVGRISKGISANASELQRLDLERESQRTQAANHLRDMLTDLKERVARKARLAYVDNTLELSYKAS